MAETVFWPLKKGIPTEEELARLADNIQQDWKRLGAALGLKEKVLKAIEVDIPNDVYERALAVLQKWKKKMGRKATYDKLAAAFNDQLVQRPALVKTFSSDTPGLKINILRFIENIYFYCGSPNSIELIYVGLSCYQSAREGHTVLGRISARPRALGSTYRVQ